MTGAYIVSVAGVITIPVPIPEVTLTLAEVEVLVQEAYNAGYDAGARGEREYARSLEILGLLR